MNDRIGNIKGAIFDMDGTLLDSMGMWNNTAYNYLLNKNYAPEVDLCMELNKMKFMEGILYIKDRYNMTESEDVILYEMSEMIKYEFEVNLELKPYVRDFLMDLKNNGVSMCVATATNKKLAELCLKRIGIMELFEFVLSCEDMENNKNFPDIYEKSLEILDTNKKETYVFEDALYAAITAKKADFPLVGVFDEQTPGTEWEEIKKISDISIISMYELLY